jgi:leader peptidase (prepilin peptidase) / N-methyltransferase
VRRRVIIQVVVWLVLALVGCLATDLRPALLPVLSLAAVTPALVIIDQRDHRLPNTLVVPMIAVGLLACGGEWFATAKPPTTPLLAGATYAAFLYILTLVGGMGMGDVKLGAALGFAAWTPAVAVLGPVVAFLAGGLVAMTFLVRGQGERHIAFGPYLLGGFWLSVGLVALARTR